MKSKGTQTMQKIVIKKPWGVEIKDYKAGDPIPAGTKFKIFDAKDTDKIDAYADSLDESATYQKKRFLEPAYMYNESAEVIKESDEGRKQYLKYVDDYEKDIKKYIDWMRRDIKAGNTITLPEVCISLSTALVNALTRYNNAVKTKTLTESYIITDTSTNNKPVYFHYGKFTGYDWGFDKNAATKFSTKEAAERMIEKMRQEGMLINSMKVVSEGRIAKGYENLDADEKARHLLSHPSSKYMNDLKSENITERAIRKAVKEMLGKPDKRDPQFITDVNEEGEAPAIANTTAEVANPDLPLKLKEGENSWEMGNGDKIEVKSDIVILTTKDGEKFMMSRKEWENGDSSNREPNWRKMKESLEDDKAKALEEYKQAKSKYLSDKSDENWKNYIEKKNVCMALGVRI